MSQLVITSISVPIDWYAAISLFSQNKIEEARLRLLRANNYTPYNINILTHLGNVYEKKGLVIEANLFYEKALKISPNATISKLK